MATENLKFTHWKSLCLYLSVFIDTHTRTSFIFDSDCVEHLEIEDYMWKALKKLDAHTGSLTGWTRVSKICTSQFLNLWILSCLVKDVSKARCANGTILCCLGYCSLIVRERIKWESHCAYLASRQLTVKLQVILGNLDSLHFHRKFRDLFLLFLEVHVCVKRGGVERGIKSPHRCQQMPRWWISRARVTAVVTCVVLGTELWFSARAPSALNHSVIFPDPPQKFQSQLVYSYF